MTMQELNDESPSAVTAECGCVGNAVLCRHQIHPSEVQQQLQLPCVGSRPGPAHGSFFSPHGATGGTVPSGCDSWNNQQGTGLDRRRNAQ